MLVTKGKIAKKYALAFFRTFEHDCTEKFLQTIQSFINFIDKNKLFKTLFTIPSISIKTKHDVIEQTAKTFQLHHGIKKLIEILLQHKRIELLQKTLQQIIIISKQQKKEEAFVITSSHKLTIEEKNIIFNFIKNNVPTKTTATFITNPSLISGIRIQSNMHLWERSIAKQLQSIEQTLLRQGEPW